MNFAFLLSDFLDTIICNLPALIALIAGMACTMATWQRHPLAARWAMLGFSWMFVTYLLSIFWRTIGMFLFFGNAQPMDIEEIVSLLVLSLFEALAYLFFLAAFHVARTPYRPRHYYEDDEAFMRTRSHE